MPEVLPHKGVNDHIPGFHYRWVLSLVSARLEELQKDHITVMVHSAEIPEHKGRMAAMEKLIQRIRLLREMLTLKLRWPDNDVVAECRSIIAELVPYLDGILSALDSGDLRTAGEKLLWLSDPHRRLMDQLELLNGFAELQNYLEEGKPLPEAKVNPVLAAVFYDKSSQDNIGALLRGEIAFTPWISEILAKVEEGSSRLPSDLSHNAIPRASIPLEAEREGCDFAMRAVVSIEQVELQKERGENYEELLATIKDLPHRFRIAMTQRLYPRQHGALIPDDASGDNSAYKWLMDEGYEDDDGKITKELPDVKTWKRYVREGRQQLGQSPHPRGTRPRGRSIVDQDEI